MRLTQKVLFFWLAAFAITFFDFQANSGDMASSSLVLEDFEDYPAGLFPTWKTRGGSTEEASNVYKVMSSKGDSYLHASTKGMNDPAIQIGKLVNDHKSHHSNVKWDIKRFPVLNWRWRVQQLPTHANETNKDKNDSSAGVYVVFFKRKLGMLSWKHQPYNILKYVWSTEMSPGRHTRRGFAILGLIPIVDTVYIPLQKGNAKSGKWVTERVNVLEDYRRHFGESPKYNPIMIAILSDSDDTESVSIADYDDFIATKQLAK